MTKTLPRSRVLAGAMALLLLLLLLPATARAESEYTASGATRFTFTNSGITVAEGDYNGYKTDGTALTINAAGTYIVSGVCSDGSIKIKKGTTGVTLVLNGLTLTSGDTAPIACNKSTEVTIVAASGTTNTLTDSAKNNDESYPGNENAGNAVIRCKDGSTVTLCGSGTLNIAANGKNGIKSGATTDEEGEASLTIRGLTLNITASVNDAINAEQELNIESGTLSIAAKDDAIHCDYVMNVGANGTAGPSITITECYEGLEAATLNIRSGSIDITSTDDCLNAANSDLTDYSFSMTISGGAITAYSSTGDGFDSNGDLTISGGTVVVWTANTADNQPLDADGTLSVTGGTVLAAGGSSGMGVRISASQPYVTFGSAGGMGGGPSGMNGRPGGMGSTSAAQSSASLSKGSAFTIRDSSGSTVYSGTAKCNASYVFFSSAKLTSGGSYSLYSGSSSVASASAQTGTSSSGMTGGGPQGGPSGSGSGQQGNGGNTPPALPDDANGQPPTPPDGTDGGSDGSAFTPPMQSGSFTDVSSGDWYYEAVQYACKNGLMTGTGGGAFSPNATVTRGMLVTILYRLEGTDAASGASPFTDISSGSYCEQAAAWAAANGIVSGYGDGRFGPNDALTREQLAAILYRYAQYKGCDLSAAGSMSGYSDASAIGGYARTAMAWANAEGLITGTSGNLLSPKGTATRAQTAVILMRFCQRLAG